MPIPFFSVVIPVHNKAPHVERSIQSVLNQKFEKFELIIVDDASTDSSLDKINEHDDSRIKVLHRTEPGPGGYAARNLGIREAKAKWVAFLDADDKWEPSHLQYYFRLVKQHPDACFFSSGWKNFRGENKGVIYNDPFYNRYYDLKKGHKVLSFDDYLHEQVQGRSPVWTSVVCSSKELLLKVGGFPEGKALRGGDVDTWLRCIEAAKGMLWSSHIGATYYRDSINMVTKTKKFEAQCERDTVEIFLRQYSGGTGKLLKQFSNRRTIAAWRQNTFLDSNDNISLIGNLYLTVNTVKNLGYTALSIFPNSSFQFLRNLYKRIR